MLHASQAIGVRLSAILTIAIALLGARARAAEDNTQPFRFGAFERTLTGLSLPTGAAIADDGTLFIADAGSHRIVAFSRDGQRLREFGSLGDGDGQLHTPSAIAIGGDGLIHVVDSGNDRVSVFKPTGEFVRAWGKRGLENGEFCNPQSIALSSDRVVIADTGNQRVQVFDAAGGFLFALGSPRGRADDFFRRPVDVAIDASGRMFVVDVDRPAILAFEKDGTHIRSFGDYGPFIGLLNEPMGIACSADEILVVDTANHRVQFFDQQGEASLQWGVHDPASHEGDGRIHYPQDITIGGGDDAPFAVICEPLEHRCQIFKGRLPGEPEQPRQSNVAGDVTHFGARITIDGRLLLIPEPEHHFIYVLDMERELPVMISQSGTRGTRFGQFLRPTGLLVNEKDRTALAVDPSLARLQTFSLAFKPDEPPKFDPFFAKFVRSIDFMHERFSRPLADMRWPLLPEALRRDAQGNLHLLDPRNAMVFVFDPQMKFVRAYGEYGSGAGQLRQPTDLAFSPDGAIAYVVDAGNFRVQTFNSAGKPMMSFGSFGDGDGQFRRPFGIAVDATGDVFISDVLGDSVQKFDASGKFLAKWGSRGGDKEQLWRPMGMAIDSRNRLIVIDHGNHRAQMYGFDGEWLGMFGAGRAVLKEQMAD